MTKDVAPPHGYQLWRFGIISPLLYRTDNDPPLQVMMLQLSQKSFTTPRGELRSVSAAAIREWYYRYEQGGIGALANKKRSDRGKRPRVARSFTQRSGVKFRWSVSGTGLPVLNKAAPRQLSHTRRTACRPPFPRDPARHKAAY
jgi:hypothetical protein